MEKYFSEELHRILVMVKTMKNIFIIIAIFFFSTNGKACICNSEPLNYKFTKADFVGRVIVKKIYTNKERERYYKADIEIKELYKGEAITSIYIHGNNGRNFDDSCDIFIDEGQEVLVYLKVTEDRKYKVEICSEPIFLNKVSTTEFIKNTNYKKIQILRVLKSKNVDFVDTNKFTIKFSTTKNLGTFLRSQKGIKLDKKFAIYEVTFKEDLSVKCVQKLSGFRHKIDRKIKRFLKKSEWSGKNDRGKPVNVAPNNSKHIVIIYYYQYENNGYLSLRF